MAAFFLVVSSDPRSLGHEVLEAQNVLAASGLGAGHAIIGKHFLLQAYPKIESRASALREFDNGDFVLSTGTLIYDGKLGTAAVEALYTDYNGISNPVCNAIGHFAVIIKKGSAITILTDRFGGYNVYFDENRRVFSSSLLVVASFLKRLTLTKQGVYEYVFNGVVSGNDTLFNEIKLLPKDAMVVSDNGSVKIDRRRLPLPTIRSDPHEALIDEAISDFDEYFRSIGRLFGNRVRIALSGGYDSRLILAMLKRHHVEPNIYVYGHPTDNDVRLAAKIAEGENLKIECIDKNSHVISPEDFQDIVQQNLYGVDGYSWDGVLNNGIEQREKARRVSGNAIVLNGGGGEIYRNFFYLRDHSYPTRKLLWAFYSQFDPAQCTPLFNSREYYETLEQKIYDLIGGKVDVLSRSTIEWLYHTFRCRSWDGRVNTINGRHGYTALPFLEARITEHASCIPIRYKNHGAFEAELIRRVDQRLSCYPSSYSHSFSGPPPLRRVIHDWGTYFRPPRLRRLTFRVKSFFAPNPFQALYLSSEYVARVLPKGLAHLDRLFILERLTNENQLVRILSLEVLLQRFDAKLACDF